MMVPTHTENFSIQAKLESVKKIGGTFEGVKPPRGGQGDEIQHSPSLNLFQHASWQGIRRENFGRKKDLMVLSNDLSI